VVEGERVAREQEKNCREEASQRPEFSHDYVFTADDAEDAEKIKAIPSFSEN